MPAKKTSKLASPIPESTYKLFFEQSFDGIVLVDKNGIITDINEAMLFFTKFKKEEVTGMPFLDFSCRMVPSSEDIESIRKNRDKIFKDALKDTNHNFYSKRFEVDVKCCDGIIRNNNTKAFPLIDSSNEICGFATITRDTTELRAAEQKLEKSNQVLELHNKQLEQKNSALLELTSLVQQEKKSIQEKIDKQIKNAIMPVIYKQEAKKSKDEIFLSKLKKSIEQLSSTSNNKELNNYNLTRREKEICTLLKSGLTTKEIASYSDVNPQTVEKQRKSIRKKLGLKGKTPPLRIHLQNIK